MIIEHVYNEYRAVLLVRIERSCHVDDYNWGNQEEDMTDVGGVTYVHFF